MTTVLIATAALLGVLVHLVNPQLDPASTPISDLAAGRHGWLMTGAFVAWGLAGFWVGAAVWRVSRRRWPRLAAALVLGASIGPWLAAIFQADPMTTPDAATSLAGTLHAVGAMLSDLLLPAGVIILVTLARSGRELEARRGRLWCSTIVLWLAALVLTAAMVTQSGMGAPLGWFNRLHVVACLGFLAVVGAAARGGGTPPHSESPRVWWRV